MRTNSISTFALAFDMVTGKQALNNFIEKKESEWNQVKFKQSWNKFVPIIPTLQALTRHKDVLVRIFEINVTSDVRLIHVMALPLEQYYS